MTEDELFIHHIDTANLHLNRALTIAMIVECCGNSDHQNNIDLSVVGSMLRVELEAAQKALGHID